MENKETFNVGDYVVYSKPLTNKERRKNPGWRDYTHIQYINTPMKIGYCYWSRGSQIMRLDYKAGNFINSFLWVRSDWCKKVTMREYCLSNIIKKYDLPKM